MRPLRSGSFLSFAITLALLAGCSSEQGPNLKPTSVTVLTAPQDVQAAHRLDAQVAISSVRATEGVGVAWHVFPKAQYLAKDPELVGSVLGYSAHDVPQGGATFAVELQVPWELAAGEYLLVPEVDPQNTIAESDEKDQTGPSADLVVRVEHRDDPRLMMEQAVLDVPAFELPWAFGAPPRPLGLTVLVRADSHAEVPAAELSACVRAKGTSCISLPLGSWDAAEGKRLSTVVIEKLQPGEATSAHLDLHLGTEHYDAFKALLKDLATACLSDLSTCSSTASSYGANLECATSCLSANAATLASGDTLAMQACLLKCLPFEVVATIGVPVGAALYEPKDADPGRSLVANLQLVAPPPADPSVPASVKLRTLGDLTVDPCGGFSPLILNAERVSCTGDVTWLAKVAPGTPASGYYAAGSVTGTNSVATYLAPTCDHSKITTRVIVQATACEVTASVVVTLAGLPAPTLTVQPPNLEVTAGAEGAAAFTAKLENCASPVTWSLDPVADPTRLEGDDKGALSATSGATTSYRPPATLKAGPPITVTLRAASAPCNVAATAPIKVRLPKELKFEKAYAKELANDYFGAGVDLYSGATLDLAGGRAKAEARVPVKVFGKRFDLLHFRDEAMVDPRQPATSFFDHKIEAFDFTVHSVHCPGDAICTGEIKVTPEALSKCLPQSPPNFCIDDAFEKICLRTSQCAPGLKCMFGKCTKTCKRDGDCGAKSRCFPTSKIASPNKKVFVIVVVPVTVEGQVCAQFGLSGRLQLLVPDGRTFAATLGPFFEAGGYASAAAGYTGLLALGVEGELVLVRDDLYGKVAATIDLTHEAGCPASGCVKGELRESFENVLTGGQGKVYLFADYLTLDWCKWHPCLRPARAKKTILSWGPLFEVANVCKWDPSPLAAGASECKTTADCNDNCVAGQQGQGPVCAFTWDWPTQSLDDSVTGPRIELGPRPCGKGKADCIAGRCVDRLPGILCASQRLFTAGN